MKILIAAGGSGGHIFPALCVSDELKKENHHIRFVTTEGLMVEKIKRKGYDLATVCSRGLSLSSLKNLLVSVFCMFRAIGQSLRILKNFRPDVVVGFGGYGAFPIVFSASMLHYPTLIHEQNVVPGKANRVLSFMVDKIAISFERSKKYFNARKTVLTGCPCRINEGQLNKNDLTMKYNLKEGRVTILALGGSQGSHRINQELSQAMLLLKKEIEVQLFHICGKSDYDTLREAYKDIGIPVCLFIFLDEMNEAYQLADLVISRAGAVTVSEIAMYGLPAILIPYPFAGGHQKENAKALEEVRMARIIEEKELSAEGLKNVILEVLRNPSRHEASNLKKNIYFPDAAKRLASEALRLSHEK